ncbi:alpha/beta fold hydrolase [Flavicella sp.]|uniref:alpha/beta fold hydrolase n=1 Tax=Flavicella sp. TaxID=2957742 RepID=UPI00260F241A|nr:alpha/beta fold hydrolase [Flavicella sp.]MDG1803496.1 alpha/beta fold hydrolase [Flavicella sp.]MDG2280068.1 alpha/beta fold hydrolase [Flavicella sp.]
MNSSLKYHSIVDFTTETGVVYDELELSYEVFGQKLHSAPIVLVNHALTGNSDVASPHSGWWKGIISEGNLIDTNKYTIISFNIPGNGFDKKPDNLIENYKDFTARDVAQLFGLALQQLKVEKLHAVIGGSLGGGISWEMSVLFPSLADNLIVVASDWKASDWILAHNKVQEQILLNSKKPVHDARMMAMMFYRTAGSFKEKFNRTVNENLGIPNVESWLLHHGFQLENRFHLQSYKMVNHLLSTLDIVRDRGSFREVAPLIKAKIIQIGIDSDFFFVPQENIETKNILDELGIDSVYKEIVSLHGHDGFLVEDAQLKNLLKDVF